MDYRSNDTKLAAAEELNIRVAPRVWEEVWLKGDFSALDELFDPKFIRHDLDPAQGQGWRQNEEFIRRMRSAFPDLHFSIDDVIAKGDKVATRYHFEGTHLGDALGFKARERKLVIAACSSRGSRTERSPSSGPKRTCYTCSGSWA